MAGAQCIASGPVSPVAVRDAMRVMNIAGQAFNAAPEMQRPGTHDLHVEADSMPIMPRGERTDRSVDNGAGSRWVTTHGPDLKQQEFENGARAQEEAQS